MLFPWFATELQTAYLLHQVVSIVQSRHGMQTFQSLQIQVIGIVEIQSAAHIQQMTDGELLPHRILLHQFRQIVGHGIIDTLDIAVVNGNAAQQRGNRLGNREHRSQTVGGKIAPIFLIDDAVVLDNEHTLCLALHIHRLHESDILTVWRLGVEMQGINP